MKKSGGKTVQSLLLLVVVLAAALGGGLMSTNTNEPIRTSGTLVRPTPYGGYKSLQLHTLHFITSTPASGSCPGGVPVALDATSQYSGDSVSSLSWPHTTKVSCSNILIVSIVISDVKGRGRFAVGSLTYGGTSLTRITALDGPLQPGIGSYHNEVWYLVAPAIGTHQIVANFTTTSPGALGDAVGGAVTYYDVNQVTPMGTPVTNSGSASPAFISVPSAPGEVIHDVVGGYTGSVVVNDPSQKQLWYQSVKPGQIGTAGASSNKSATGNSTLMQWTNISAWTIIGIPLNPS